MKPTPETKLAIILTLALLAGFSLAWWYKPPKTIIIERVITKGYQCKVCKHSAPDRVREKVYVDGELFGGKK